MYPNLTAEEERQIDAAFSLDTKAKADKIESTVGGTEKVSRFKKLGKKVKEVFTHNSDVDDFFNNNI